MVVFKSLKSPRVIVPWTVKLLFISTLFAVKLLLRSRLFTDKELFISTLYTVKVLLISTLFTVKLLLISKLPEISTSFLNIPADEMAIAIFLPVARFKKGRPY